LYDLRLINKHILAKLAKKNKGNKKLIQSIKDLIEDVELNDWKNPHEVLQDRKDADNVYKGDFFIFNLNIHRTMVLIEFEDGEATVVWAGNHDEYEITFKNNRNVIKKWLKSNNWI
jgi:mRNA interferase HigB